MLQYLEVASMRWYVEKGTLSSLSFLCVSASMPSEKREITNRKIPKRLDAPLLLSIIFEFPFKKIIKVFHRNSLTNKLKIKIPSAIKIAHEYSYLLCLLPPMKKVTNKTLNIFDDFIKACTG